jgi:uncharacterized LabA/DUF88 family protein
MSMASIFTTARSKAASLKWLNLVELAEQILPADHSIDQVKYFTARVSGALDSDAPRRQQIYLSALATLSQVEIHYGRFLAKTTWRPIVNFPVADATIHSPSVTSLPAGTHKVEGGSLASPSNLVAGSYRPQGSARAKSAKASRPVPDALITQVHAMEEKGSDVNLAAHLLNDAWKDSFDVAVVISNDTDLVTPIHMVSAERGKSVFVTCPGRWQIAPSLAKVATHVRHIHRPMLAASQFPYPIPGTVIHKPSGW